MQKTLQGKKMRRFAFSANLGGGEGESAGGKISPIVHMVCKTCPQQWASKVYWGESSRTLFQHGKEHWSAHLGKTEASVLHKHETEHHQQMQAEWKIKYIIMVLNHSDGRLTRVF